jgi:transposase
MVSDQRDCQQTELFARQWMRQAQRDGGERPGQTTAEKARIKELERENRELRQANEILRKASAYFASL